MKKIDFKKNADIYAAVVLLLILVTFAVQFKKIKAKVDIYFPAFIMIVLTVLLLALIVKIFVKPDIRKIFTEPRLKLVAAGIVIGTVWILVLNHLGFFTTSFLCMTAISLMLDEQFGTGHTAKENAVTVLKTCLVNLAIVVIVYFVFNKGLDVPTPKGILI